VSKISAILDRLTASDLISVQGIRGPTIVDQICVYEGEVGAHASGTVGREVLEKIAELVPACQSSVETGCGKSTILAANQPFSCRS
jgi:hypothetical protein